MSSAKSSPGGSKLPKLSLGQVFILLGLLSAVLTILIFRSSMTSKDAQSGDKPVETTALVVARHSIPLGETISPTDLKVVQWPKESYPKADVFKTTKSLVGRVTASDIIAGQPIFQLNVAGKGAQGGLNVLIPKGYRAITISVSESKGVAGFVKPGNYVDVLATFDLQVDKEAKDQLPAMPLESELSITDTVVQNLMVLAIAQDFTRKDLPYQKKDDKKEGDAQKEADKKEDEKSEAAKVVSTVTLAVTPEQAEKIALAEEKGSLKLVLRNQHDHQMVELMGTVTDDILTVKEALLKNPNRFMPPPPPMPVGADLPPLNLPLIPSRSVEVIQGTESNTVNFN